MQNYKDSDYALNRYSEGIVYRFADGTAVTYTLADYLAENPGKTEAGFLALKEFSDSDYFAADRAGNAQTKKNLSFGDLDETMLCHTPSPEDLFIGEIDAREEAERRERRVELKNRAVDALTDVQRRRYLMYHVDGLTIREIAETEGAYPNAIQESLQAAAKKIKKVLAKS